MCELGALIEVTRDHNVQLKLLVEAKRG